MWKNESCSNETIILLQPLYYWSVVVFISSTFFFYSPLPVCSGHLLVSLYCAYSWFWMVGFCALGGKTREGKSHYWKGVSSMGGQLWLSLTPHIMKDHLRVALNCTLTKSLLLKLKIGKRQRHSNCVVCCCCCSDCLLPFSRASSPFGAWKIPRSSSYAIPAYPVPTFWA